MMKKSINWIIPLLMLVGLGLYGCTDSLRLAKGDLPSDIEQPQEGSDDGEWIPYTMEFNASDMITPPLRALTKDGENDIESGSVRVLVFNTTPNTNFAYEAPVTSVTPDATKDKATGKVQLLLKHTDAAEYKFVMLANVPESGKSISTPNEGTSYEEVMKLFTYDMPDKGAWKNGELPMWGEVTTFVNHNDGANPQIGTVNLIRAVARIDVGLNVTKGQEQDGTLFNETATGITGIELTSVKFYNMNNKGTVAPAASALEDNKTKVTAPTIPDGATAQSDALDMTSELNPDKNLLLRSVYVPEAANDPAEASKDGETLEPTDKQGYMKRPYMVVGLKGADKSNKDRVTYFRIDFLKKNGEEATATYKYLPLLRNYRYLVNIQNVGGPGFDDENDAKQGPAANIMYNVVVWNESEMTNVQYDGQYMLGVSKDKFKFYREGGSLSAKVQTSFPKGFTIEGLPDWISYSIKPAVDGKNETTDEKIVTFTIDKSVTGDRTWPELEADAENALKAAYVQAGRMKWLLHFEQSKDLNVAIQIYSDPECTKVLQFVNIHQFGEDYGKTPEKTIMKDGKQLTAEEVGATVTFYVKTEPENLRPIISTEGINRFIFSEPEEIGGGVWKYTVTAPDVTEDKEPFDNFISNYHFTITHVATDRSASADLVVQQVEYNAIPYYDEDFQRSLVSNSGEKLYYLMDGNDKKYWVKGNAKYNIELLESKSFYAKGDVITKFDKVNETKPLLSGKEIHFTAAEDLKEPKLFEGEAKFRISSPNGLFPTREYSVFLISAIKQPEANTYMMKANKDGQGQAILIPVSRINTAANYFDKILEHDGSIPTDNTSPYPLPTDKENLRLNRLDEDDSWSANIVWTDIHDESKTSTLEKSGLEILEHFGGAGPESYILVKAGATPGNILIEVRSGKLAMRNTLWSWMIWILDEYPTVIPIDKTMTGGGGNVADKVYLMSHHLGAKRAPIAAEHLVTNSPENAPSHGMLYQWGRKDPFPAPQVLATTKYYNGEGKRYYFENNAHGDRANRGYDDATAAAGASYSVKQSIEKPASIVAHQTFWNFESMPFRLMSFFRKKWVFRYFWNHYPMDSSDITDNTGGKEDSGNEFNPNATASGRDPFGGKTVFDPSPYGFRIMNQKEAMAVRLAYYHHTYVTPNLYTVFTGWVYDGDYTNGNSQGNGVACYAVCQARDSHAGSYLVNTIKGSKSGWTAAGNNNAAYRRSTTISVRPVADIGPYGKDGEYGNTDSPNYLKYLPK